MVLDIFERQLKRTPPLPLQCSAPGFELLSPLSPGAAAARLRVAGPADALATCTAAAAALVAGPACAAQLQIAAGAVGLPDAVDAAAEP